MGEHADASLAERIGTGAGVLLSVLDLEKRYGPGCEACLELTGPQRSTNICPRCRSVIALRGVSFDLREGEILGIVGESGSGKSTLVQCIYFDQDVSHGEIRVNGQNGGCDVTGLPRSEKRRLRSRLMGMVYQNPMQGLRLDITSGANVAEKLLEADVFHFARIRERATGLLARTEIPAAFVDRLPRTLSGGMQQRIQIAKALANNPPLVLLDEVTSGLDVSVQARVLDLVRELQRELGMSMIVVSHDMGVIRLLADRTVVMKDGGIVEQGLTDQILEDPQHPYTQLLVHSTL
ncbi:MAG TPA: ATP-binding cassette domain-containing protein [Spirochaetia bacterium]|nr:ATP-binding cassette domain-containing protein [Spirochaetia bacterium]